MNKGDLIGLTGWLIATLSVSVGIGVWTLPAMYFGAGLALAATSKTVGWKTTLAWLPAFFSSRVYSWTQKE
jgi:hypothetical protein